MLLAVTRLEHDLPWYFGLAVALAWFAVLALIVVIVYRRRQARAKRREEASQTARRVRDDRSVGPGTDVELW